MQSNISNIFKFLFFLGIGILLIWLATHNLSDTDIENIQRAFEQTNYLWIFLSLLLGIISHVSRAMRWKILLQPLGFNPKLSNTFFAVMVGYLANFALPRLGEVSRCGVLTKYEKIPFTEGFGTVVAERVIDMICLIIIFFATLIFQFNQIWDLSNQNIITPVQLKLQHLIQNPLYTAIVFFVLIALGLTFLKFKHKAKSLFSDKIMSLLKGFADGLKSVKEIKRPYWFLFHTVFIWFLYVFSLYLALFSLKETAVLGMDACLAVFIFSTLGVIFVPGGTGASQAMVTKTLTSIFSISFTYAFAFAWLLWTSQFILILILGVMSLILLPIFNKSASAKKG